MATRYLVNDVASSLAFYSDVLGFEIVEQWGPAFAIVQRGSVELWLSGPETSAARPMPDGSLPVPGGWNRVVVEVSDLAALADQMIAFGVALRSEVISGPGGSQLLIEDPSGNPIELFQPR